MFSYKPFCRFMMVTEASAATGSTQLFLGALPALQAPCISNKIAFEYPVKAVWCLKGAPAKREHEPKPLWELQGTCVSAQDSCIPQKGAKKFHISALRRNLSCKSSPGSRPGRGKGQVFHGSFPCAITQSLSVSRVDVQPAGMGDSWLALG